MFRFRAQRSWRSRTTIWAFALCSITNSTLRATTMDSEGRLTMTLRDGSSVTLYRESAPREESSHRYYYLPGSDQLRIARRPDGTPEFLFLKYIKNDEAEPLEAVLHFLIEWSLTADQEKEIASRLASEQTPNAILAGAVPLLREGESASFTVISATLSEPITSGHAPLYPGNKAAVAAYLPAAKARILAAIFERDFAISDISFVMHTSFNVLTPAADGKIVIDWSRYEAKSDEWEAEYLRRVVGTRKKTFAGITTSKKPIYAYTYQEVHDHFDFLVEENVVTLDFAESVVDERVAGLRKAFFEYFLNATTRPAIPTQFAEAKESEDGDTIPNIRQGQYYSFRRSETSHSKQQRKTTFNMKYRLAVRRPHSFVGNASGWYDAVKGNRRCVQTAHVEQLLQRVLFQLDKSVTKALFEQELNHVSIAVQATVNGKRSFDDHFVLDATSFEHGQMRKMVIPRGPGGKLAEYKFCEQWSFRDGAILPAKPVWQKGSHAPIVLTSPFKPQSFELEADLDDLQRNQITRVTAQIYYPQQGGGKLTNISINAAGELANAETHFFMDRHSRGYLLRLVFHHKTLGPRVTDWQTMYASDDYRYAAIPAELGTGGGATRRSDDQLEIDQEDTDAVLRALNPKGK